MSLNPLNTNHRARLVRALDHSYQQLQRFNRQRATTVHAYLGVTPDELASFWNLQQYKRDLPQGNLLQLSGLSHQIALAYGEPRVLCKARTPEHAGLAHTLQPALNRMATLLDLGETHRMVAADSYFGYGIYKVGVGYLPESARIATGLDTGPCVWRVGQPEFLYDITAKYWSRISYVGDMYPIALNDAQEIYPEHADRLSAFTDVDRIDSPTVLARPTNSYSAEEELWLVDIYFPSTKLVATWPVRASTFGPVGDEPLAVREWNGHWSGPYQVLTHLYSPDELVPIAQSESVKSLHFLFNDILHLTGEQARNAKKNPMYQAASDKDMHRLWDAADRHPVSVTNPQAVQAMFEIPGPSQDQSQYMGFLLNLFEKATPTYDQPQTAPTATQGQLVRNTTNAIVAEARRKAHRCLELVFRKLGHLMLNNQDLVLPSARPLRPGSNIMLDTTFGPGPHHTNIDDFDIAIEPFSTIYRSPEERTQQLVGASGIVTQAMMLAAQGAPINVEKVLHTLAEYQDLPELIEWYEEVDPLTTARASQSRQSAPRPGTGHYIRENVSTKTADGAMQENLANMGAESMGRLS